MAAGRIYGPSWGGLRAGVESGSALKKQWFLHVFIRSHKKNFCYSVLHFGGQCSRFISNNTIWAPPVLPQEGRQSAPKEGFRRVKNCLLGLWGAFGVPGRSLETFSGFLLLHLWPWKLSGVLFGCFWGLWDVSGDLFRSSLKLFDTRRDIFSKNSGQLKDVFSNSGFCFSVFLFFVAVCEETWSSELPEGSIFML